MEIIEKSSKSLSKWHKGILVGFVGLASIVFLFELWNGSTPYKDSLNWLGSMMCFVYLWNRPEAIDLKKTDYQSEPIDSLIFLSLILWVIAFFIPF